MLLTESARFDPAIVSKIKTHLLTAERSSLPPGCFGPSRAMAQPIEQIAEISTTGNVLNVDRVPGSFGQTAAARLSHDILVPQICFMTNDAWPVVRGTANGRGAPLLIEDHYSNGLFLVLIFPSNAFDLYDLPQPVLAAIRRFVLRDFPVQFDAPSRVSLFAYDNNTFVAESFLDHPGGGHRLSRRRGPSSAQPGHRRSAHRPDAASSHCSAA